MTFLPKLWHSYRDCSLILKMTIGFLLGLLVAFILAERAQFLAPLGSILLNLLNMIVIPVIMLTIIEALSNLGSGSVARIGVKAFAYYIFTTLAAVIIGLSLALFFNPGLGLSMPDVQFNAPAAPSFANQLVAIFPANIFAALARGNILALIFLALAFGAVIVSMRRSSDAQVAEYGELLNRITQACKVASFRLLDGILQYAPIGVFALVASQLGQQGFEALVALAKLSGVVYAGLALQVLCIYVPLLWLARTPFLRFLRYSHTALLTAFTTQSSSGTVPLSLRAAEKAGLSNKVAGFVIPVGATVNMDGAVIRYAVSVVLAANIVGHAFSFPELGALVLTATLISIGTAGVPGAGLVGLTILLTQAGLPLEVVALVAGVDVILGMGATMVNVTGDLVGAHLINYSEKEDNLRSK